MTECPKCGAAVPGGSWDCPHCGIVFGKYKKRATDDAPDAPDAPAAPATPAAPVPSVAPDPLSGVVQWGRIALVALLLYWTWVFLWTPLSPDSGDSFLHLPNLIFHEAGHVIFAPLGQFMSVLGGSLMQTLIPVIAGIAFVRQAQPFSAAVCAWWAGQNLTDLAPYIADARALRLTLLGGRTGAEVEGHDWEYLLTALGVSHLDRTIGTVTHAAGILIMVAALAYAAWLMIRVNETA